MYIITKGWGALEADSQFKVMNYFLGPASGLWEKISHSQAWIYSQPYTTGQRMAPCNIFYKIPLSKGLRESGGAQRRHWNRTRLPRSQGIRISSHPAGRQAHNREKREKSGSVVWGPSSGIIHVKPQLLVSIDY